MHRSNHREASNGPRGRFVALLALLIAPLAFASACSSPGVAPPLPTSQAYTVGPPDQLTVSILPEPEILREVVVRPDGMISVELIGDIPAAGRSTSEIAADIEKRIGRYKRDARVTVALKRALSSQVTVLGEVTRNATFPISRETRLTEALGMVGGPSFFAARTRVRVIRHQGESATVYRVNLKDIQKGDLSTNMMLQGGDIVYLPPTRMAVVGYAIQSLLFPIQQLIGFGSRVTTTVFTGGVGAGF
jgi:polysaccharide export outer membrane protein